MTNFARLTITDSEIAGNAARSAAGVGMSGNATAHLDRVAVKDNKSQY